MKNKVGLLFVVIFIVILICIPISSVLIVEDMVSTDSMELLSYRSYGAILTISIVLISWIILGVVLLKPEPKVVKVNMADRYREVSVDELKKYGIDIDKFKIMTYKKFKDIHEALTDYNYDILKTNLTNDLYMYYMEQLEELKNKNYRNIMKDFEFVNFKIYNINNSYGLLRVDVYLNVRMLDYMIDMDTGEFIRGNATDAKDFEFELTFEKRGKGRSLNNKYVMSKKTCINEMEIKKQV